MAQIAKKPAELAAHSPDSHYALVLALECLDRDGPASAAAVLNTHGRAAIAKASGTA